MDFGIVDFESMTSHRSATVIELLHILEFRTYYLLFTPLWNKAGHCWGRKLVTLFLQTATPFCARRLFGVGDEGPRHARWNGESALSPVLFLSLAEKAGEKSKFIKKPIFSYQQYKSESILPYLDNDYDELEEV